MYVTLNKGDAIFDLGPKTIEHYNKLISGAGTVFISGPPGFLKTKIQLWDRKSQKVLQTRWPLQ